MINIKSIKRYCCEDISLIENYEIAVNDKSNKYVLHHKNGLIIPYYKLKELDLYYNRPAVELIFLTQFEHKQIHALYRSTETRNKISNALKGRKSWNKGKHHSEETKNKISKSTKGRKDTIETKRKKSEIAKKRTYTIETREKMSKAAKGRIPWNKGLKIKKD